MSYKIYNIPSLLLVQFFMKQKTKKNKYLTSILNGSVWRDGNCKLGVLQKLSIGGFKNAFKIFVSLPFIYAIIILFTVMHLFLELYHQVCFRLYGMPLVKARDYFVFDRSHLPYLNWLEKINCLYCSYVNGLIAYMREITGRTERFWCPIKHSKKINGFHEQYNLFIEYSDGASLRKNWKKLSKFSDYDKKTK